MAITPDDILADNENYTIVNGIRVRKGTIAAAISNAKVFLNQNTSQAEKDDALRAFKELLPGMVALGLDDVFTCKDPELRKLMDAESKAQGK